MATLCNQNKLKQQIFTVVGFATMLSLTALPPAPVASTPARGEVVGSLALSDLDNLLINQSPKLSQEIKQALKGSKKDDVGCVAPLVRRPFDSLNHSRIAPFTCFFANHKSLTIQAKNLAKLPNGRTIPLEQLLKRKNIPQNVSLQFELTSWKWTNTSR